MLLLDDCFSGLDGGTEQTVYQNLCGPNGLLRRMNSTVLLVSNACKCSAFALSTSSANVHSDQFFEHADEVVVLGHGRIDYQGPWSMIGTKVAAVAKFSPSNASKGGESRPDLISMTAKLEHTTMEVRQQEDQTRPLGYSALYCAY